MDDLKPWWTSKAIWTGLIGSAWWDHVLLRLRLGIAVAERWWHQVDASQRVQGEHIDGVRAERARELFFRYRDKRFSFTDCTSFALMRELRLTTVLTTDAHFKQMGFSLCPGPRAACGKS